MKKFVLLIIGAFLSTSLFAAYVTPLNGPGVDITRVFSHENGALTLYISGDVQNLDQCTATYRVHIPHDIAGRDTIVSTALTAFASGKKIGLHASHCSTTPFWGGTVDVPIINNLWVF